MKTKTAITQLIEHWERNLEITNMFPDSPTKELSIGIITAQIPALKQMLELEKESQRTAFETGKIIGGDFDEYFKTKFDV